jgi:SAM-dependent methyltransferase
MESIRDHYEQWPFPGGEFASREGLLLLRYLQQWLEQVSEPERSGKVLDVGCGTGHTTCALARHFPAVHFVGIDISEASLEAARREAARSDCVNVTFEHADFFSGSATAEAFDVVLCLGVLHHLTDLESAFRHLVTPVRETGYLVLWLYGRYGRIRHVLNQRFIRILSGERSGTDRLEVARTFLEELGSGFATDSGFYSPRGSGREGIAWLLQHPPWLADQMLPAFERGLTMTEILQLLDDHDLQFAKWLGVPVDLRAYTDSDRLNHLFDELSPRQQLIAIDHLVKPAYYLVAARRERPQVRRS